MNLNLTIRFALLAYFAGMLWFYFRAPSDWVWFAVGGGLAVVNVFFAAFAIKVGLRSLKNKGLFLGLLMLKSLSFVMVVALVLVFLKPKLLPFTLGVGLVIVGAIIAAIYESRHYFKKANKAV